MKSPLKVIEDLGCPTTSYIAAIQFLGQQDAPKQEYERRVQEIITLDEPPECDTWYEARVLFMYVVQETIRIFSAGVAVPIMENIYDIAIERTHKYINENPWNETMFNITHGLKPEVDEHGNEGEVVAKKGAKKEVSEQLFKDLKAAGASRNKIIDAFVDQVGMSRAGATTYFHTLKKEFGFSQRDNPELSPKAESKQELAERLYNESADKSKPVIIALFTDKLGTSKLGAQTYYYACKKKYENRSILHTAS